MHFINLNFFLWFCQHEIKHSSPIQCSRDKNLEILFRTCNFRFAFSYNFLRCIVKSSLLSIMISKRFSEALFLIMIFLHLKFVWLIRCSRSHKMTFVRIQKWFLIPSSKVLPNSNKALSAAKLQMFDLSRNRKMSLITVLKRRDPRQGIEGQQLLFRASY